GARFRAWPREEVAPADRVSGGGFREPGTREWNAVHSHLQSALCRAREAMTRLAFTAAIMAAIIPAVRAGDWPQWRGPDRSNVSAETGLLKEWPEGGPKLVWTATGLGQSVVSVAVAGGRVFTVGYRGDDEFAVCVDVKDGKKIWETRIGAA